MIDPIKILEAPWSKELVDTLNEYQRNPYTCGACRDKYHTRFYVDGDKLVRDKDFTAPVDKVIYLGGSRKPTPFREWDECDPLKIL
jgi:hypothetical protein